jgi:glucokinase
MSSRLFNIGIDLGGTNIKFGLVDEAGKILLQDKKKTEASRGCDAIIASIVQGVEWLLSKAGLHRADITSIGVGVPGTVDSKNGIVVFAPNLFWREFEVVKVIRNVIDVPVYVTQDTRAAAWAEYLIGAGKGLQSVASVTLGTGTGCGMVFDGRIFNGALNTAGEFGHQIVELDGSPCVCGRHGCLETRASGWAIVRHARERIDGIGELLHMNSGEVEVQQVFQLALEGNAQARQLTESFVNYIGMGLVNLININSIELICISGGISNAPAELLLDPLVEFVRKRAYEPVARKVRICKSPLGVDAPMIGAALLYQHSHQ